LYEDKDDESYQRPKGKPAIRHMFLQTGIT